MKTKIQPLASKDRKFIADDGPVASLFNRLIRFLESGNQPERYFEDSDKKTLCRFMEMLPSPPKSRSKACAARYMYAIMCFSPRMRDFNDILLMFGRLTRSINSTFLPRVIQLITEFASNRNNYHELSHHDVERLTDEFAACWNLVATEVCLLSPEELENVCWPERPAFDEGPTIAGTVDLSALTADEATEFCREDALWVYRERLERIGLMLPEDTPAEINHPLAVLSDSVKCLADELERDEPSIESKRNKFDYALLERLLSADTSLSYECFGNEDGPDEPAFVGFCDEPTKENAYKKQIVKDLMRYLAAACRLAKEIRSKAYDDLVVCQEKFDLYNGEFYEKRDGHGGQTSPVNDLKAFIRHLKIARSVLAADCRYKTAAKPVDANVVSVEHSAGKSLRAAMKDPGGRPKKINGGAKVMTQKEMAEAFGKPCTKYKIENWEAYERTGGRRGNLPFGFVTKDNEKIIYSAELRLNPTSYNKNRLSALLAEFQSRHRVKEAIDRKRTIHCRTDETLAKASGQIGEALRRKS